MCEERVLDIFFFNDTATTEIYTLSLHDALPICLHRGGPDGRHVRRGARRPPTAARRRAGRHGLVQRGQRRNRDRKSTRLNSSHAHISYAVFCLKKKKKNSYCTFLLSCALHPYLT